MSPESQFHHLSGPPNQLFLLHPQPSLMESSFSQLLIGEIWALSSFFRSVPPTLNQSQVLLILFAYYSHPFFPFPLLLFNYSILKYPYNVTVFASNLNPFPLNPENHHPTFIIGIFLNKKYDCYSRLSMKIPKC